MRKSNAPFPQNLGEEPDVGVQVCRWLVVVTVPVSPPNAIGGALALEQGPVMIPRKRGEDEPIGKGPLNSKCEARAPEAVESIPSIEPRRRDHEREGLPGWVCRVHGGPNRLKHDCLRKSIGWHGAGRESGVVADRGEGPRRRSEEALTAPNPYVCSVEDAIVVDDPYDLIKSSLAKGLEEEGARGQEFHVLSALVD